MVGRKRFLAATTALAVAVTCVVTASMIDRHDRPDQVRAPYEMEPSKAPWTAYPRSDELPAIPAAAALTPPRPVFRHSVIPGGSYTRSELQHAILRRPEVAEHFREVSIGRMVPATLSRDGEYYVSYKKNGSVYWTSHKLRLPQGEPVLTDGAETIRARCGNRLSELPKVPRLPAPLEPPAAEFEWVEVPSLPGTPVIQPPGHTSWLPVLIPWIPILITPGHDTSPEPPGPVVPEPSPLLLLAVGLGFVLAARYLLRES
jgi:hypothetical protein